MEISFEMTPKGKRYKSPMQAIKGYCLDCSAGSPKEVKMCSVGTSCPLYAYRVGVNPFTKGKSPEARAQFAERMKKRREENGKQ